MRAVVGETPDWMHFRVKLDGAFIERCFEADEEAGYVLCFTGEIDHSGPEPEAVAVRHEGRVELVDVREAVG